MAYFALGDAGTARAADEDDPRPQKALAACSAGDVAKGIAILAELYAVTRNPAFVFNQGRCYQQNGQLEPAADRFHEYLRVGKNEPPVDLERARLFLREIDETLASRNASEAARLRSAQNARRSEGLRVASIAFAALSVAAIGSGVFLGLKAEGIERDIEREFKNDAVVTDPAKLQKMLTNGGRYETWQWVSYGIGVASLAGAITTFALRVSSARTAETAPVSLAPLIGPTAFGGQLGVRF